MRYRRTSSLRLTTAAASGHIPKTASISYMSDQCTEVLAIGRLSIARSMSELTRVSVLYVMDSEGYVAGIITSHAFQTQSRRRSQDAKSSDSS